MPLSGERAEGGWDLCRCMDGMHDIGSRAGDACRESGGDIIDGAMFQEGIYPV